MPPPHARARQSRANTTATPDAEEGVPPQPLPPLEALPRGKEQADDAEALMRVWLEVDEDRSGSLDADEVAAVLRRLGLKAGPQDVADAMTGFDKNGNGTIEFDEFTAWYPAVRLKKLRARTPEPREPEPEPEWEAELGREARHTLAEKRGTVRYAESAYGVQVSIDAAASDQGQLEVELRRIVGSDRYQQARAAQSPTWHTRTAPSSGGGGSASARSRAQRLRFFDDLDAWIGAAPKVLTHSHGEEDLKKRLLTLAHRSSWETVSNSWNHPFDCVLTQNVCSNRCSPRLTRTGLASSISRSLPGLSGLTWGFLAINSQTMRSRSYFGGSTHTTPA